MIDSDSSRPNKKTLAILSGSKVTVWDLQPSSIFGDNDAVDTDPNKSNVRSFDLYPEYDDGVPISSLAWNHNQMVIATSSGIPTDEFAHDNIVLLSSQSGQKLDSFQHDSEWKQKQQYTQQQQQQESSRHGSIVNSINFGGKSRYLCIGDESGAVCLWDLKKKVRVRQFFHRRPGPPSASAGNSSDSGSGNFFSFPSLQVSLDPTDTYVMSLSPSAMYQYNLRDGQLVGTLEVPKDDDVNSNDNTNLFTIFSISNLEPNICAIGTNSGNIYVYDITSPRGLNQTTTPHSKIIRRHSGGVTGLAFSPDNPNVLFSSGTDGIVFVHNKANGTSHKVCSALDSNNSIESLSLHADGVTCAIGCQSGDVYVYNLRYIIKGGEIPATLLSSYQSHERINSLFFAPPPKTKDQLRPEPGFPSENNNKNETKQQQSPSVAGVKIPRTTTNTVEIKDKTTKSASKVSPFLSSPNAKTTSTFTTKKAPSSPSSPKKVPSFLLHRNSKIQSITQSPKTKTNMTEEVREVVREEIENLQDEMEEQLRNLHIDMINQFHQQSQEIENILSKHMTALEHLSAENQQLREENETLRREQRG